MSNDREHAIVQSCPTCGTMCQVVDINNGEGVEFRPVRYREDKEKMKAALRLAKDMFIANDLSLPRTFEIIDDAINGKSRKLLSDYIDPYDLPPCDNKDDNQPLHGLCECITDPPEQISPGRYCAFPDCMGGYENVIRLLMEENARLKEQVAQLQAVCGE